MFGIITGCDLQQVTTSLQDSYMRLQVRMNNPAITPSYLSVLYQNMPRHNVSKYPFLISRAPFPLPSTFILLLRWETLRRIKSYPLHFNFVIFHSQIPITLFGSFPRWIVVGLLCCCIYLLIAFVIIYHFV